MKMCFRHREAAAGFFDTEVGQWVEGMDFEQAAMGLDNRIKATLGCEDSYIKQIVAKKTIDDYWGEQKRAHQNNFDFNANRNEPVSRMREAAAKKVGKSSRKKKVGNRST